MENRIEIKDEIYVNGEKLQIISGSIHYFRVVPEYWRDRLEKLKAMGCNTVETYVAWNVHEPYEGEFHFEGEYDLCRFMELAQELGLYVILRPSPYICAEWEFGGFPAWLLTKPGIRLRCNNKVYLDCVERYYDTFARRWVTSPIITPKVKVSEKFTIELPVGWMVKEMIDNAVHNNKRRGGPTIMPPNMPTPGEIPFGTPEMPK